MLVLKPGFGLKIRFFCKLVLEIVCRNIHVSTVTHWVKASLVFMGGTTIVALQRKGKTIAVFYGTSLSGKFTEVIQGLFTKNYAIELRTTMECQYRICCKL